MIALARAPATVANLGPGLDVLGLALAGEGDRVRAEPSEHPGVTIRSSGHPELPLDPTRNTAGIAAMSVLRRAGAQGAPGARGTTCGVVLAVTKGVPLSGGQGGSAASAAAAAVAVNAVLGGRLGANDLLEACLEAETAVAGRHADNLGAALLGGIVLVRSLDPLDVVRLPVPERLVVVIAEPDQRLETAEARALLPERVDRALAVHQAAQVGALVAALASGDLALLGRAIDDRIAEPVRAPRLIGFAEAKAAALGAGALACSISGSGPAAFALVERGGAGERVAEAMAAAYRSRGVACRARVAEIDRAGARLEET